MGNAAGIQSEGDLNDYEENPEESKDDLNKQTQNKDGKAPKNPPIQNSNMKSQANNLAGDSASASQKQLPQVIS